jgi:selenide,water dikinase
MYAANARSGGQSVQFAQAVDKAYSQMLFDPQTSGGLLIAVPADHAQALYTALQHSGYIRAAIIGEVTARTPASTHIVEVV